MPYHNSPPALQFLLGNNAPSSQTATSPGLKSSRWDGAYRTASSAPPTPPYDTAPATPWHEFVTGETKDATFPNYNLNVTNCNLWLFNYFGNYIVYRR
jgi:hypothetical protein